MADDFAQRVESLLLAGDTIISTHGGFPAMGKKGTVFDWLEIDATSGGLKVDIVDASGITLDVDLNYDTDEVTVWGSSDGGTTRYAIRTDASGRLITSNISSATAAYNIITDGTDDWNIDSNGWGEVVIKDFNISSQTNDVKITLDGEIVRTNSADSVYTYGSTTLVKDTPNTVVTESPGSTTKYVGVIVSGFGLCEWDVQFGTTASEATIFVVQTTPSNTTQYMPFPRPLEVASGETILVEATNREKNPSTGSDFTGHATLVKEA